jgi:hypothetical protein
MAKDANPNETNSLKFSDFYSLEVKCDLHYQ